VVPPASGSRRILFLDDDPGRVEAFLRDHPGATWVRTAEQCLAHLAGLWDEVHLDHDLGGEVFVEHERDDCGMAVVRWLCERHRDHLRATRFIVHTRNPNAACVMHFHLQVMGYDAEVRPFGPDSTARGQQTMLGPVSGTIAGRVARWLRRLGGRPGPGRAP
jgi:hypothetical protein